MTKLLAPKEFDIAQIAYPKNGEVLFLHESELIVMTMTLRGAMINLCKTGKS